MTNEDVRRPGATRRAMPKHRSSGATPPEIILGRPQGRGPRPPGASDALSVASCDCTRGVTNERAVFGEQKAVRLTLRVS